MTTIEPCELCFRPKTSDDPNNPACDCPEGLDQPLQPHQYVPSGIRQHRTCAHPGCGRGANQAIHKA